MGGMLRLKRRFDAGRAAAGVSGVRHLALKRGGSVGVRKGEI